MGGSFSASYTCHSGMNIGAGNSETHPRRRGLGCDVVERIGAKAAAPGSFEYFGDDIGLHAEKVLAGLAADR